MSAPAKEEDYRMPKTLPAGASWIVRIAFCCWFDKIAHQSQVLCLSIWLQEIFQRHHPRNICHCSM
jgi:hypothetical protein